MSAQSAANYALMRFVLTPNLHYFNEREPESLTADLIPAFCTDNFINPIMASSCGEGRSPMRDLFLSLCPSLICLCATMCTVVKRCKIGIMVSIEVE